MKTWIQFTLNGSPVSIETDNDRTLLKLLREDLHITSLKNSCNVGECGACTILLDGEAVRSCLLLAVMVDGKRVDTLESLGSPVNMHPIQKAYLEVGAVQCGFCTPGMILATKALLDKNPNPTREEARLALSGNICRCTGYKKILDAVLLAAKWMRGED